MAINDEVSFLLLALSLFAKGFWPLVIHIWLHFPRTTLLKRNNSPLCFMG